LNTYATPQQIQRLPYGRRHIEELFFVASDRLTVSGVHKHQRIPTYVGLIGVGVVMSKEDENGKGEGKDVIEIPDTHVAVSLKQADEVRGQCSASIVVAVLLESCNGYRCGYCKHIFLSQCTAIRVWAPQNMSVGVLARLWSGRKSRLYPAVVLEITRCNLRALPTDIEKDTFSSMMCVELMLV
jgi:hypothetical protein